ncbi:MAG TPA: MFS transporter [Usitatibacter sp.]|nr:MFS transporter [Usitatibacter sp.]
MRLALVVFVTILTHTAYNGTRLTFSLEALSLGATPLVVGTLVSLMAALPMALGVFSGRLVDRVGVRKPMVAAVSVVIAGITVGALFPGLAMLPLVAITVGSAFALFQICVQHMVGDMSHPAERRENFSLLALGFAVSNFLGPTISGVAIDHLGFRATFCILAAFACASLAIVFSRRAELSHTPHHERDATERSATELLRDRELRRVFVVSGLLASAWDLFTFVMPIYGTSIGLSATTIGLILGSFAAATFVVRLLLPWIQRRVHEWPLITTTFAIACLAYAAFPMVRTVPLLAALSFVLGFGLGATQPSLMALVYATAPPGRAAEAVGLRTVALNTSTTFFPIFFGGLGSVVGVAPVFLAMSAVLAAGGFLSRHR